jgi:hypothetical protein
MRRFPSSFSSPIKLLRRLIVAAQAQRAVSFYIADLLVRQMVAEQARFRRALMDLEKEKAMRRQQLQAAVQAVHRLVNVITVQHVLHRALNSAVTALDAQANASKEPRQKKKANSASVSIREAPATGGPPGLRVPFGGNPSGEGTHRNTILASSDVFSATP